MSVAELGITQAATMRFVSLSPAYGVAGSLVTITGMWDVLVPTVCSFDFGSTDAASVVARPDAIVLTVPPGFGTVFIQVACVGSSSFVLGTAFTYAPASTASIIAVSAPIVAGTQNTTLIGTVSIAPTAWVALTPVDAPNCVVPLSAVPLSSSLSPVFNPSISATTVYRLCYSTSPSAGYVLQSSSVLVTVVRASSGAISATTPSVVGDGSSPTFTLTVSAAGRNELFLTTSRVALARTSQCSTSGARLGTITPLASAATLTILLPRQFFGVATTLAVCVSTDEGNSWVEQAVGTTIAVVPVFASSLSPSTIVSGALSPLFEIVDVPFVSGAAQIGFSTSLSSCTSLVGQTALSVAAGSARTWFTLASVVTAVAGAPATSYRVCLSLDGGAAGSWSVTGLLLNVTGVLVNGVASVTPNAVISGREGSFALTRGSNVAMVLGVGTRYAFTLSASTCDTLCGGGAWTRVTSASATLVTTIGCGVGTAYLCLAPESGAGVHQGAASAIAVLPLASSTVAVISPSTVPLRASSGVALALSLAALPTATAFSPRIAFAPRGGCNVASLRVSELAFAPAVSVTIVPSLAVFTPPLASYAFCFTWGSASGVPEWLEQTASLEVVMLSSLAWTSTVPSTITNVSAPTLFLTGLRASPGGRVAIALPGGCNSPLAWAAVSSDSVVTFPAAITTGTARTLALCQSTNAGASYLEQSIVRLSTAQDPKALVVTELTPRVLGNGLGTVSLSITSTVTALPATFALAIGSCLISGAAVSVVALSTPNAVFGSFAVPTTGGLYASCLAAPVGAFFVTQVLPAASLLVVTASTGSIASVAPTRLGVGALGTLTFTASTSGVLGGFSSLACQGCVIAFAPSTLGCAPAPTRVSAPFSLPSNPNGTVGVTFSVAMTSGLSLPSVGSRYLLCFSSDGGATWFDQTSAPTIEMLVANSSSVQALVPAVVGVGAVGVSITAVGAPLSVFSRVAIGTGGSCGAVVMSTVAALDSSPVFTLDASVLSAGVHAVCFSVTSGAPYVLQASATFTVVSVTAGSVSAISPSVIGSGTSPTGTLTTTLVASPFTAIAFVAAGSSSCAPFGALAARTVLSSSLSQPLGGGSNALLTASQSQFAMCASMTAGLASENWVLQTATASVVTVQAVRASSLVAITPSVWGVGFVATLNLSLEVGMTLPTSGTLVAFTQSGGCFSGLISQSAVNSVTHQAVLSAALSVAGSYRLCMTVDNGASWALINLPVVATLVAASSASLSALVPASIGVTFSPRVNAVGAVLTPGTRVAYTNGTCVAGPFWGLTSYPVGSPAGGVAWMAPPAVASTSTLAVCLSYDGGLSWTLQASVTMTVVVPSTSALTLLAPRVLPRNSIVALTVGGQVRSAGARVVFVPVGSSCSSASALGQGAIAWNDSTSTGTSATVTMANALTALGEYHTCYTVDSGASWFAQTALGAPNVTAVALSPSDITALNVSVIAPRVVGTGLTVTFASGVLATTTSAIGFALLPAGCGAGASAVFGVSALAAAGTSVLASGLPRGGSYQLCYTIGAGVWAGQSPVIEVIDATATLVNGSSVRALTSGLPTTISFTATRYSPFMLLGLIGQPFSAEGAADPLPMPAGGCAPAAMDPTKYALTGSGGISVTLSSDGVYGLCVSPNGGLDWTYQTLPGISLASATCAAYTQCSVCSATPNCQFCLSSQRCMDMATNCTSGDAVCPAGNGFAPATPPGTPGCVANSCPALSIASPAVRAASTGLSLARLSLSYLDPVTELVCSVLITDTVFVKQANATRVAGAPFDVECAIPSTELGALDGVLEVLVASSDVPYTRGIQPGASVPVAYYDCAAVPACTGCWSSERPDCGYCAASQACATRAACAPVAAALWMDDGVCPLITAVSPATVAAEGGETVTLTVSPLAPGLASLECRFGELRANATPSAASDGSLTCVTPAQTRGGDLVVAVFANDELVAAMAPGLGFTVAAPLAIARPRGPVLATGAIAGLAVGLVCCVLLLALVAVYAIRKRARDAIVKPPELTPALREQIVYGAPAVLSADDKRRLPHLDDFFNRLAMNEEFIALLGEATAATEQDKLTKCVNVVYETRGRALDLLLFQVSREVRTSYSQSTLFRTNSFATKLFKMFSKIHGLDYVHATLGRTLNELLLDVSDELAKGKTTNLRDAKAGDGDAALSRFAMLTKAQRLFQQIQRSEARLPIEFRYLFRHVQACLRERFPVRTEDLAAVISSTLLENLAATSTSFSDGTNAFETISGLQGSLSGDMAQLSAVLGPVSMQLDSFGASMKDVMANVTRMSKVVAQLHGAVDPRSTQAQALVAQHSAKQNSIAVGGFFFLRFLVPSFTAPEAYALVHEVPDNEQRKLLVVLGKVVQNLSNGLEFGAKEAHMVQFNEFITENQTAMNALFDKLATVPSNAPSLAALHDRATEVPRRRYEESIAFVYAHTLSVLDKLGEALQTPTGVPAVDGEHRLLLQILREVVVSVETKAGTENNAGLQARIAALSGMAQAASGNSRVVVVPATIAADPVAAAPSASAESAPLEPNVLDDVAASAMAPVAPARQSSES